MVIWKSSILKMFDGCVTKVVMTDSQTSPLMLNDFLDFERSYRHLLIRVLRMLIYASGSCSMTFSLPGFAKQ